MAIISNDAREAATHFGSFIAGKLDELKSIREAANRMSLADSRPAPPKIYQFSDSILAHLSFTFKSTSFPDGFTSPEKLSETIRFFQDWLNTTVVVALENEKEETRRHTALADQLLKFIRDFDDVANFVLRFLPEDSSPKTITAILRDMEAAFVEVHASLQHRHAGRSTITIVDEYDVQDLYSSMLKLFEPDILLEEPIPSNGAKRARADLLLTGHKTIIEFKMTRESLSQSDLFEQLSADCALYQRHPDCEHIHFFVYDPHHRIRNEVALIRAMKGGHKSGDASKPVVVSCVVVR